MKSNITKIIAIFLAVITIVVVNNAVSNHTDVDCEQFLADPTPNSRDAVVESFFGNIFQPLAKDSKSAEEAVAKDVMRGYHCGASAVQNQFR